MHDDDAPKGPLKQAWDDEIARLKAQGKNYSQAVAIIEQQTPGLRQRMIDEVNATRRDRPGSAA
ncbi:MAG: hypothetical protein SH850_30995 [Planctomycetaceae bacterium]|nr:hypothetical protein [Planctomycetaceae bacterium]